MAGKKHNEILDEQRHAREEFLMLKKMQNGEIDAGPKPGEIALKPETFTEKRENFWYHYKWHTIGLIVTVAVLAILISQCVSRPKYDFNVVYFSYTPIMDNQAELVAEYFEKYGKDLNGDGKVEVGIMNCSFSETANDPQYKNTQLQKLQSYIVGEYKAILYITDDRSIKFFDNISSEGSFFDGEPVLLPQEFYDLTGKTEFGALPEGLKLSRRITKGTVLENNKTAVEVSKEAQRIYNLIKSPPTENAK